MKLEIFRKALKTLDGINTHIKTAIICLFTIITLFIYIPQQIKDAIDAHYQKIYETEVNADVYTLETAQIINGGIINIQKQIPECYNVLLLNYHNSSSSVQGFKYLYLNCLTESPKYVDDDLLKDYWSELDYVYYDDELKRIHAHGYVHINNIEDIRATFPKFYKKFKLSGALAADIIPLKGVRFPIGLVVILYKNPQQKNNLNSEIIFEEIQKISTILDCKYELK